VPHLEESARLFHSTEHQLDLFPCPVAQRVTLGFHPPQHRRRGSSVGSRLVMRSAVMGAESAAGFDNGKLQNGVLEPLRESDLIE
jgi:hypothetical protein